MNSDPRHLDNDLQRYCHSGGAERIDTLTKPHGYEQHIIADLTFLDRKVAPFLDSCLANSLMELALQGDSLSENQDVTL